MRLFLQICVYMYVHMCTVVWSESPAFIALSDVCCIHPLAGVKVCRQSPGVGYQQTDRALLAKPGLAFCALARGRCNGTCISLSDDEDPRVRLMHRVALYAPCSSRKLMMSFLCFLTCTMLFRAFLALTAVLTLIYIS